MQSQLVYNKKGRSGEEEQSVLLLGFSTVARGGKVQIERLEAIFYLPEGKRTPTFACSYLFAT
jgi:hypothetical protein